MFRQHRDQRLCAAEQQDAVAGLRIGAEPGRAQFHTIAGAQRQYPLQRGIQNVALRPEPALRIAQQIGAERLAGQAIPAADGFDGFAAFGVQLQVEQARWGVEPDAAIVIDQQAEHVRVVPTRRVRGLDPARLRIGIIQQREAGFAADPQTLRGIQTQRIDVATQRRGRIAGFAFQCRRAGPVPPQAIFGGDPQITARIGQQASHAPGVQYEILQRSVFGGAAEKSRIAADPQRTIDGFRQPGDTHAAQQRLAVFIAQYILRLQRGIKHRDAAPLGAEQDAAVREHRDGAHAQIVRRVIDGGEGMAVAQAEGGIARVVPLHPAAITANPELFAAIAQQGPDFAIGQRGGIAGLVAKMMQQPAIADGADLHAVGAPGPELVRPGLEQGIDRGIARIRDRLCDGVFITGGDAPQPAIAAADPYLPVIALEQGGDARCGIAQRDRRERGGIGCAPGQAVPAAQPERAVVVEQQ